jgi:phosphoglycerate kinase
MLAEQMYCTLKELNVKNKRVLLRVDYNVPIRDAIVQDNTRIVRTLPTLTYLLEQNCTIILMSHCGRPNGQRDEKYSLKPIVAELKKLLHKDNIFFCTDCTTDHTEQYASRLKNRDVLVLENLRFHKEEKENSRHFAYQLAQLADIYVNDAFAAAHRKHASVDAITNYLPSASGFLIEKEIRELSKVLQPKHPLICVVGGLKISDKIGTIKHLAKKADKILVGGAVAASFLKAAGYHVGASKTDAFDIAFNILQEFRGKIVMPLDVVIGNKLSKDAEARLTTPLNIPKDWMILDIGPATCTLFKKELESAQTIMWNGPLGVFEYSQFARGTKKVATAIAAASAHTIVGGSETVEVVNKFDLYDKYSYVATGGGAALEFLSGRRLPAIEALERNVPTQKVLS